MQARPQTPLHSRRLTSRAEIPDGLWVYWWSNGRAELSRVRNLSGRGLFIATPNTQSVAATVKLDFLVQEGQISAEAVIRHVKPLEGMGLKFTSVPAEDCPRLAALIARVRSLP